MSTSVPLHGSIAVPGDKSISHRAVVLSALAAGESVVRGVNVGDDVRATCDALTHLGARCDLDDTEALVHVEGCGWEELQEPADVLDARNSGTTLRTLLGVCAALDFGVALTGDATLRRRPMLRIVAPLRAMGASIDGRAGGRYPPLWVRGGDLRGRALHTEVASAQVKSALILAGLRARGITTIVEPRLSRDHTERMLRAAGVEVSSAGAAVTVRGGQRIAPLDRDVPGDISAAAFFVVAAALVEGSDLTIERVALNPTRTGIVDALTAMGADVLAEVRGEDGGEPFGRIRARASELMPITLGGALIPRLIDELPVLAVAATQARGTSVIRDAHELRVKESDRIDAMARGLAALGARVTPRADGLVIEGPTPLAGGVVDARGDHRVAMAFAVARLIARGPVEIVGWEAVGTSLPEFGDILAAARRQER
jgi:3-phosphoshikimate 1-carboxyvinyltransferase